MESNDFVKAVLEEGLGALRLLAPQVIDADYEALTFVLHHLPETNKSRFHSRSRINICKAGLR